jgi:hypothetical protein
MKYKVISAAFDLTQDPPAPVKFTGDNRISPTMGEEVIDTEDNALFRHCENVWDVEDTVLAFWNRLNDHDKDAPDFTHNPTAKVVVIDVRPVE